jgi:hypothetical protein
MLAFPTVQLSVLKFNECPKDTYRDISACGDVDVSVSVWVGENPWPQDSFMCHCLISWALQKKRQFMQFENKG